MLETNVRLQSAHVLRCMEHPSAKPVYYIFEDDAFLLSERAQFAEAYLLDENRKFTELRYVTAERAAPWVQPALKLLQERIRSPATVVEQVVYAKDPSVWLTKEDHTELVRITVEEGADPMRTGRYAAGPLEQLPYFDAICGLKAKRRTEG
ncbi:hypothetical protein CYMTET_46643 [Cymbomonas tetramitiformis]|uniref:Uncharacterized protein n=1 Tax=Cymbomonas tetramitiformis TaxID=36881 RepID=A0AAE0BX52_9CHLO|nr:hypothetical protein CYMTET_46643 [Cymbomonas tetramitiformis]